MIFVVDFYCQPIYLEAETVCVESEESQQNKCQKELNKSCPKRKKNKQTIVQTINISTCSSRKWQKVLPILMQLANAVSDNIE